MAETSDIIHLVVETGPDQGRRINVLESGARIGRSSQNDIELTDPSISRFQCRVFFKPDGNLWVADLGSTNESLVNGQPVLESKLNVGDKIEIGETVIRVVAENLYGRAPAISVPPPLPSSVPPPSPPLPASLPAEGNIPEVPAPASLPVDRIDLGLDREKAAEASAAGRPASARRWLWLVLVMMIAVVAVLIVKSKAFRTNGRSSAGPAADEAAFSIYFEKVQGSVSNIFRYELTLENDMLTARIDSLSENRHVTTPAKKVAKDILLKLADDIERANYFKLDESYQGLQPNTYDMADMEITIGSRTRRCVVLNRIEPDDFKHIREMIEQFAKDELGLITISLSPEKLQQLARDATLQGQKLYGEREVRYQNLFQAIRAFQEAQIYLETIEPKPDFYSTAVSGLAECKRELEKQCQDYQFLADKSIRMKDWNTAADNLRIIKEIIPDRADPRYIEADKKLVDVSRRIKR